MHAGAVMLTFGSRLATVIAGLATVIASLVTVIASEAKQSPAYIGAKPPGGCLAPLAMIAVPLP